MFFDLDGVSLDSIQNANAPVSIQMDFIDTQTGIEGIRVLAIYPHSVNNYVLQTHIKVTSIKVRRE